MQHIQPVTQHVQPVTQHVQPVTVLESRKNKEINLRSDYTKNKLQRLVFAAILPFGLVYKVGIWLTMFTMDWQINNQGIVLALQSLAHRHMKAVLLNKRQ